jgi:hypothetical protein
VLLLDADKVDEFKQCYEGQANLNTIAVLTKGGSVFEKRKNDCQGDRKEIEVQIIITFQFLHCRNRNCIVLGCMLWCRGEHDGTHPTYHFKVSPRSI